MLAVEGGAEPPAQGFNLTSQQLADLHQHLAALVAAQPQRGGASGWAFLLGVAVTLLLGAATWLLVRRSQSQHSREKAVASLHGLDPETFKQLFSGHLFAGNDLPPWVRFPDVERTAWINTVMRGLWPNIERAACKWAWEHLEAMLQGTDFWRPKWLETHGITLLNISLGDEPPVVTGVKVYGREHHGSREEMALEYDFSWVSRMEVKMQMRVAPEARFPILGHLLHSIGKRVDVKVGVRDLVARGKLRAVLRPLINELPVVGAVKLCFVEAPVFSYQVSVYGGNPLWVPGLESWINSFIKHEVLRPVTFPAAFSYRLADGVAGAEQERPAGLLDVRVVEAVNVPRMDMFSPGDPYLKLCLTGRERLAEHTSVKCDAVHPVWNEDFQLLVHNPGHQSLLLSLWDSDIFTADDEIGSVELPLQELNLAPGALNDLWIPIRARGRRRGPRWRPLWLKRRPAGEACSSSGSEGSDAEEDRPWGSGAGGWSGSHDPEQHGIRRRTVRRVTLSRLAQQARQGDQGQGPGQQQQQPAQPGGQQQPGRQQPGGQPGIVGQQQARRGGSGKGQRLQEGMLPSGGSHHGGAAGGLAQLDSMERRVSTAAVAGTPAPSLPSTPRGSAARLSRARSSSGWEAKSTSSFDPLRSGPSGDSLGAAGSAEQAQPTQPRRRGLAGLSRISGGMSGGGGGGPEGKGGEQQQGVFGAVMEQGRGVWDEMRRVVATALPQRKLCQLHVQVSYIPFTQQDIQEADGAEPAEPAPLPGAAAQPAHRGSSAARAHEVLRGGVLYVHLNQAHNLARKRGLYGGPTKDMQCTVRVGRKKKMTERSRHTNSRHPVFNQTMEFIVDADTAKDTGALITLQVLDRSWLFPTDFKGQVQIPLRHVIERQRLKGTFQLEGVPSGQISMELEWLGAMGL